MKKLQLFAFAGLISFSVQAQSKWALGLSGHMGGQVYEHMPFGDEEPMLSTRFSSAFNFEAEYALNNRWTLLGGIVSFQERSRFTNTFISPGYVSIYRTDLVGPSLGFRFNFLSLEQSDFYVLGRFSAVGHFGYYNKSANGSGYQVTATRNGRLSFRYNTQAGMGFQRALTQNENGKNVLFRAEITAQYFENTYKFSNGRMQHLHLMAGIGFSYQF